jgi:hypothetical protein
MRKDRDVRERLLNIGKLDRREEILAQNDLRIAPFNSEDFKLHDSPSAEAPLLTYKTKPRMFSDPEVVVLDDEQAQNLRQTRFVSSLPKRI